MLSLSRRLATPLPSRLVTNNYLRTLNKPIPFLPYLPEHRPITFQRTITSTALAAGAGILGGILSSTFQLIIKNILEQRRETNSLVTSQFSQIFFITNDLQSRLYNILQGNGLRNYKSFSDLEKRDFETYTSFTFARCIAMINKMENEIMDIRFFQAKSTRNLMQKVQSVKALLADNSFGCVLTFYRSQQLLISSEMRSNKSNENFIDYKEFLEKIKMNDSSLQKFNSAVSSFTQKLADEAEQPENWYQQIQHLQHLLVDIMSTIDPNNLVIDTSRTQKFYF